MVKLQQRLDARSMPEPNSGCVLWLGSYNEHGYGWMSWQNRPVLAHRLAWIVARGSIPQGLHVLHRCDVRCCINVDHLWCDTQAANLADMRAKGRQARGTTSGRAKLTEAQVLAIYADKRPQRVIAPEYGINQSLVAHIRSGRAWGWLTGAGGDGK